METLYAICLGITQGITEFLPVSSSAHLIIFSYFTKGQPLPLALNIALHLGTLLAVLLYFWKDWRDITFSTFRKIQNPKSTEPGFHLLTVILMGSIPAGVIGILFLDAIEEFFHNPMSTIIPLILVGFLLWYVDKKSKSGKNFSNLNWKDGLTIGLAQTIALIPGVSRSGSTIIGGRILGYNKVDAARFSFLLGTPAMAGAAILKGTEILDSIQDPIFYTGFLVSILTGILAIKFLLAFIQRFGFAAFAIYRTALALLIFISLR